MKILIAPDSFKESMSAVEAANAIESGILKVLPSAQCIKMPMADGGEGTTEALVLATGGKLYRTQVLDPLGNEIDAQYGILGNNQTAIIEMASASGLGLIPLDQRNPLLTSTYGTGQLIQAALSHNITHLIIGIGGSATNDGGAGMFQALGGTLLDKYGKSLSYGGGALGDLDKIDTSGLDPRLNKVKIEVACDVTNPLTGEFGASHVFGPQKGATKEMVPLLDQNLKHFANCLLNQLGIDIENVAGAGAAGGLGAGLMAFLGASLVRGVDLVIQYNALEEAIKSTDLIITGEGSIDGQSSFGKTLDGIGALAKKHKIPAIALVGRIGKDAEIMHRRGITAIFSILSEPCDIEVALQNGQTNLERASENLIRLLEGFHYEK